MNSEQESTKSRVLETALRATAGLGFGASALLLWEYIGAASFCIPGEGCDVVRLSRYAKILGIHTPVYGMLAFGVLLALAFMADRRARRALVAISAAAALGALGFISIMAFELHAFCPYCAIADCAFLLFFAIVLLSRNNVRVSLGGRALGLDLAFVAVAAAVPFAIGFAEMSGQVIHEREVPFPDCVAREQQAGIVTIVEFTDFECPFCRAQHFTLMRILEEFGGNVRIVRKHYPLATHKRARQAALAGICAEEMGRGDMMADQLFAAEDLSDAGIAELASKLGLPSDDFAKCLASPATARRVAEDEADATTAAVHALPTFYIGRERLEGLQKEDALRTILTRAVEASATAAKPAGH